MSNFFYDLIDLHAGEEKKDTVLENVRSSISFKGSNFWILIFAILIASVGLNVNSTAVIIGAMLISPLMGPIVGAGFALGTYNFSLFKKSALNLFIATITGLLVAFLYFSLSPFKATQSELLARTSPNIYDVLIAFFGGLVGVIAVTRVEKGNPIPGVAIATALMPPLCTAGYGLSIGNYSYFFGALFLYLINCTFICIATYIVVKFLKYPIFHWVDQKTEKKVKWLITTLTVMMIIPSVYFAYAFVKEQQYKDRVKTFIKTEFEDRGNILIFQKVNFSSTPKSIELAFLSRSFSNQEIQDLNEKLLQYNIHNSVLQIRQDSSFIKSKMLIDKENEVERSNRLAFEKMQKKLEKYQLPLDNILPEAKAVFPFINTLSIGKQELFKQENANSELITTAIYTVIAEPNETEKLQLKRWLSVKLRVDSVQVIRL